ncbi:MAG: helix-turn-helix domain-containing protein [Clostridia bacterium]|nr:helix-turn-helix domain-containing protein [Clostridia bacterium]
MGVTICNKPTLPIKSYTKHSHNECEIVLQVLGESNVTVGENTYLMTEGDVLVIPPNTVHFGRADKEFSDAYIQSGNIGFSQVIKVHDYDGMIRTLFDMMHKVTTEKEYNYLSIADGLLDTICRYIEKHSHKDYKYPFVNDFKNVIYANISNSDFDIGAEIKKTGYNVDYFRRCFREELGCTPHEYLISLRMTLAKKMLKYEASLNVEVVAYNCGFRDSFYFSRAFKQHIGVSPREYRRSKIASQ